MKVRTQFIYIMEEQAMSDDPKISNLANLIFVQGIREHIRDAKKEGLNPREAAFYCIDKSIKQYLELSPQERLAFPDAVGFGTISNTETLQRLLGALGREGSSEK